MADYTTTALVADIRRRAMLPASTQVLSDADLVSLANDELQEYVVPLLVGTAEEYLIATETVTLVPGTAEYVIPSRAVGNKLRDVQMLVGDVWVSLGRVEPENASRYTTQGTPSSYMFQGAKVVLVPPPSSSGQLRFSYYRRPGKLIFAGAGATMRVGRIFADTPSAGNFVLAPFTGETVLTYDGLNDGPFDVVSGISPFDTLVSGATGIFYTGATYTGIRFSGSLTFPTSLTIRPQPNALYVCYPDTSPIPQIPVDLIPLLSQRTAVRALEALGDTKAEQAEARCARIEKKCVELISPRGEGLPRVVVNYSGPGWTRRRAGYWGR